MPITLHPTGLTPAEYRTIKESANWGAVPNNEYIAMALARSLYVVVARDGYRAVGMARLIGDGVFYWHVQDVVVLPEYQGRGIGKLLMENLVAHIETHTPAPSAAVGLMAAAGKEGFYEKLGFKRRSGNQNGDGMDRRVYRRNDEEVSPCS
jgi:ribosomal protein S18 acetylase RimI-like enzyme